MPLNTYDASVGVFVRGLTNLKAQLKKAEDHASATGGEPALLDARLATPGTASNAPGDLHGYTLAAQIHWAAEGAKLAIARLLGTETAPATNVAKSFAELERHVDATIAYLRGVAPAELEAGLEREVVIAHRRGSTGSRGAPFLVAFALPHFFYHLTSVYGILRNQAVPLTMGDFLGNWGSPPL